jgi:hypothetical protein
MPVFRPDPPAKVVVGTGQDGCRSSHFTVSNFASLQFSTVSALFFVYDYTGDFL